MVLERDYKVRQIGGVVVIVFFIAIGLIERLV
jgi:hypothetical protein